MAVWVLAALALVGLTLTFLSDRALRRLLARGLAPRRDQPGERGPAAAAQPPVSILRPVKGLDDGLLENLVSLARQQYPHFEILVGAADPEDPALRVAERVAQAYPQACLRVVVCPPDGALNPKVSTLRRLSALAAHDLVLISDSNVRVDPGYLAATTREMAAPGVGLVTNPVVGVGERSTGATFEALHLITFVARALAFTSTYLNKALVVGKSMLFRRSEFERLGGWDLVPDVLAEDYVIGHAYERAGLRVRWAPHRVFTYGQDWPTSRFINRHLRWGQMRRRLCAPAFLLEPLWNPVVPLLGLALLSLGTGAGGRAMPVVGALGLAARLMADRALWRRMRGTSPRLRTVLLAVPKDLLVLAIWMTAAFRRTIDWRGNLFLIGPGSRLLPKKAGGPNLQRAARPSPLPPAPTPSAAEEAA